MLVKEYIISESIEGKIYLDAIIKHEETSFIQKIFKQNTKTIRLGIFNSRIQAEDEMKKDVLKRIPEQIINCKFYDKTGHRHSAGW